jgi:hypothetical protein
LQGMRHSRLANIKQFAKSRAGQPHAQWQ